MKRIVTMVAALGLIGGACGGGDSESSATTAPAASQDETIDEPSADDAVDDSAEESSTDEMSADEEAAAPDEPTVEESTEEPDEVDTDDDSDANAGSQTISSMDDVPEECLDLMADFLREIEPIVSPVDWETASISEFETIGAEFEAISDEFDTAGEASGCNDLEFVDDSEFDLMAEFARDVAPGTVGFLEFLAGFGLGETGETAGDFETCEDAVTFMSGLVAQYDTFADVPAAELLKFQGLPQLFGTCTPDQLAYFDSPEVIDFLGGQ